MGKFRECLQPFRSFPNSSISGKSSPPHTTVHNPMIMMSSSLCRICPPFVCRGSSICSRPAFNLSSSIFPIISLPLRFSNAVALALRPGRTRRHQSLEETEVWCTSHFQGDWLRSKHRYKRVKARHTAPWERAQNERHNGLFRAFVPKGVSIELFTDEDILAAADELNGRPRRKLGYCTQEELFGAFLDTIYTA